MMKSLVLIFAIGACGNSNPAPMDAPLTNQAFGAHCTTVTNTSTECTSMVCTDAFDMLGHICSQTCTLLNMTDPSCPNGSMGQKCNMKGFCRP